MPPKKSKTKRKVRRRSTVNNPPGPDVIVYRGPTRLPETINPEIKTVELHQGGLVSSSAGTIIDSNLSSNGVRSAGDDFSGWAGLYREYRVLGIRFEYHPNIVDAVIAATVYTPVYTVIDRNDTSATGTYANVESNTSLEIFTLQQKWMRQAKMFSTTEANFISVAVDPPSYFVIKFFATGLTASTNYGRYLSRWIVQFRTRD